MNALQDEHARLATKLRDADALRKQLEQAEKDARKAQKDMEAKLKDQRDELEKLEAVHANDAAMGELDHARNQVQKYKDEVTKLERHLAAAQAEVEAKEEEFQPLKEKVAAGAGKYQELMVLTDDLGDQLEKARAPLQKSKARRSTMAKTLLAAQTQQQDLAKKSTSLRANLELVVPQVEGVYGERVHDPQARTVDQLKAEKRTLEAKIKTQEARHGGKSLSHLAAEAAAAKEVFEANSKGAAHRTDGLPPCPVPAHTYTHARTLIIFARTGSHARRNCYRGGGLDEFAQSLRRSPQVLPQGVQGEGQAGVRQLQRTALSQGALRHAQL